MILTQVLKWWNVLFKYLFRVWRSWKGNGQLYLFHKDLDEDDLRYELLAYPHRLNYSNDYSQTPLMMAIYLQCPIRTRLFLELGAELNRVDEVLSPDLFSCPFLTPGAQLQNGNSEMHYACIHGGEDLMEELVQLGSRVDAVNMVVCVHTYDISLDLS